MIETVTIHKAGEVVVEFTQDGQTYADSVTIDPEVIPSYMADKKGGMLQVMWNAPTMWAVIVEALINENGWLPMQDGTFVAPESVTEAVA